MAQYVHVISNLGQFVCDEKNIKLYEDFTGNEWREANIEEIWFLLLIPVKSLSAGNLPEVFQYIMMTLQ